MIGSEADVAGLDQTLSAAPRRPQIAISRAGSEDPELHLKAGDPEPDLVIIGATVDRPLPVAHRMRMLYPQSQIVFLLQAERLDRFRGVLPFVPNLASTWTADAAAEPEELVQLIIEAGRISRERIATNTVLGRINQRLARKPASEQARHSQLALSERYLATILTQSPDAFIAVDTYGHVIAHNDAAQRLFSPLNDHAGMVEALDLFPQEDRPWLRECLDQAMRGDTVAGIELRLTTSVAPGAPALHVELSLAPVRSDAGSVASVSITAHDISERKQAENRQRLLIDELNHRVKNTLAIVQALANQTFRGSSPADQERLSFRSRLSTLAAAHDLLTRQAWEQVSLVDVIEEAIGAACGPNAKRHRIEGPKVMLEPQTAVSFAMAIHELCTNAIKYGALSSDRGWIVAKWEIRERDGRPRLLFQWIERGGPPARPPAKRGFGTRMIEQGLAAELSGEVSMDFQPDGLICSFDAPLPESP